MDDRELKAIIESLLFVWGEPLALKDIANILEIKESYASKLVDEMIGEFNNSRRGLRIIRVKDKCQLTTRPEHYEWISLLFQDRKANSLSTAALETLAIIAYRQPITKAEIESIRGVKCDKALETLLSKDLIKELGRLERTGRPIIYGTTDEFLRYFGLKDLDELPAIDELNKENNDGSVKE
mgnify:FL=1